jgi:glyoxylase-like metal-dependent hydrolase (beta-lactamase superfamily II)
LTGAHGWADDTGMHLQIGDVQILPLSDGEGVFPHAFDEVFPQTSAEEIARWHDVYPGMYASATVPQARYGAFLLRTPGAIVLVDTGFGTETGPYPQGGELLADLASHGVMPADIDLVVFSHLHPDHVCQTFDADGEPVFEHAAYAVAAADWAFFTDPALAESFPWIAPQVGRLAGPRADGSAFDLRLLADGDEVVPGVTVVAAPGHTPGHIALHVRSGGQEAVLAGDAFFHPAQVACNEWVNSADSDPATAVASRRRIVELVLDRDVVLAGCHFPVPSLGMVRTVDGAARWLPLE